MAYVTILRALYILLQMPIPTPKQGQVPILRDYRSSSGEGAKLAPEQSGVKKALEELGFHTETLDILGVHESSKFRQK